MATKTVKIYALTENNTTNNYVQMQKEDGSNSWQTGLTATNCWTAKYQKLRTTFLKSDFSDYLNSVVSAKIVFSGEPGGTNHTQSLKGYLNDAKRAPTNVTNSNYLIHSFSFLEIFEKKMEEQKVTYTFSDLNFLKNWLNSNDTNYSYLVVHAPDNTNPSIYFRNCYIELTYEETEITIPVSSITLSPSSLTLTEGGTETINATVSPSNATNKKLSWSSNKTSVATVDSNGKVTALSVGSATIICAATDGSGKYATCSITVLAPLIDLTDTSKIRIVQANSREYDGSIQEFYPNVESFIDGEWVSLTEGTHFKTVLTSGSELINAGKYYYYIEGYEDMGYTGKVYTTSEGEQLYFEITAVNLSNTIISIEPKSFIYTGLSQTPTIKISYFYLTNPYLIQGVDYQVEYSRTDGIVGNNITVEPGTILIKIIGIGNFVGVESDSYTITKEAISISKCSIILTPNSKIYDNNPIINGEFTDGSKIQVTVSYQGELLSFNKDYLYTFEPEMIDPGQYPVTITGMGDFYGTTIVYFTIGKKSFTIDPIPDQIYTGYQITPPLTIDGGVTVTSDKFSTTFSNNINVGTASVSVTATNSIFYVGSASATFNIIKDESGHVYVYIGGKYRPAKAYIYNGGWKECTSVHIYNNGWKQTKIV